MSSGVRNKGLVLIAVLWMVVVLMVIAAATGQKCRLDTRVRVLGTEEVRCRWACRAGVESAVAVLNEDFRTSDSLADLWSDNLEDFNDVVLEGCRFTAEVFDEAGKLNINTASSEQLMQLDNMTEDIVDAILDWRDGDDNPRSDGAEQGYYQNLPYDYPIRNGPFKTIRELLLVKGVNEQLLYGEDTNFNRLLDYNEKDGDKSPPPDDGDDELDRGWIAYMSCYSYDKNVDAMGNEKVNINEADEGKLQESLNIDKPHAKWIVENRKDDGYKSIADLIRKGSEKEPKETSDGDSDRATPLDLQTFKQIADKITVDKEDQVIGRVNVNTAPKVVLAALLGEDESAERIADGIIAYREGLLAGMESIGDLLNAESVGVEDFKKLAAQVTTRSDVFTVRCFATAERGDSSGLTLQTEAVVDRSSRPCQIVYWYEGPTPYLASYEKQ